MTKKGPFDTCMGDVRSEHERALANALSRFFLQDAKYPTDQQTEVARDDPSGGKAAPGPLFFRR